MNYWHGSSMCWLLCLNNDWWTIVMDAVADMRCRVLSFLLIICYYTLDGGHGCCHVWCLFQHGWRGAIHTDPGAGRHSLHRERWVDSVCWHFVINVQTQPSQREVGGQCMLTLSHTCADTAFTKRGGWTVYVDTFSHMCRHSLHRERWVDSVCWHFVINVQTQPSQREVGGQC